MILTNDIYSYEFIIKRTDKNGNTRSNFDETFFTNIEECIKYNSIGTLNWAIHTLTIIRERIDVGQKVKYKNIDLTPDTYQELLHEHYGIYVVKVSIRKCL